MHQHTSGAIGHSLSDGAMYFAHGGNWNRLANYTDSLLPQLLEHLAQT